MDDGDGPIVEVDCDRAEGLLAVRASGKQLAGMEARGLDAHLPPGSQLAGDRPPVTDLGTAQQLLRDAAAELPPEQCRALELWVQSESYVTIACEIGVASAVEAERRVRAAIERLCRKFRNTDDDAS